MNRSFLFFSLILLTALISRCSQYAGGTTDTENAKFEATIFTTDGDPVAGASVTICSEEYTSRFVTKSDQPRASEIKRLITDYDGSFEVDTLDPGSYNLEVNDGESGALLTNFTIENEDDSIHIRDTIHPFAQISGAIRSIEDTAADLYVVVVGTDHYAPVTSDGMFELNDMPAGTFDLKVVATDDDWTTLEFNDVDFKSGETVTIDTSLAVPDTVRQVKIVLNTAEDGADISSDISNFPVLIRITGDDSLISEDDEDLSHLHFVTADGRELHAYVESFDAEAATAEIWVLIDTIYGNNDSQFILIEIDTTNTSEEDAATDADSVFLPDHGYYSVYHFNGDLTDATINGSDGVDSNTTDSPDGRIGHARSFDGSSYFTVSDLSNDDRGAASISFWFKPAETFDDSSETQGIWGKKVADHIDFNISLRGTDFFSGLLSEEDVVGTIVTKLEDADTGYYLLGRTTTFSKDEWYHVAWTWGNDGDSLYINGELENSQPYSLPVFGDAIDQIGRSPYDTKNIENGEPRYFSGTLDEFRFHSAVRSPDWVKLSYINQGDNDLLVKIVSEMIVIEPEDE